MARGAQIAQGLARGGEGQIEAMEWLAARGRANGDHALNWRRNEDRSERWVAGGEGQTVAKCDEAASNEGQVAAMKWLAKRRAVWKKRFGWWLERKEERP